MLGTSHYALTPSFAIVRRLMSKLTYLTPFFLSYSELFLLTCFRCTWLLLHLITLNDTHTLGRVPLDERSARRRELYQTAHNTHNRQTSMSPAGLEPHNPSKRAAAYTPRALRELNSLSLWRFLFKNCTN